ncbi:NAD(P) transhydrogenase subunit alpha [Mycolicibacterium helvum]|uniref:proton-translocating NAD(P)(+) transhydrogenase n=1 Tax=Mycolicibacterium helvum TaxID=1534349 RepID=A0A7I7TA03_9MYCO|nr:NAD(P) transhydrogenase subunit alpha [Mycolicibacterium helvum]BBY65820.1 NADP transhydrogenase subunit alpha [Mycolicibacterium helvum]
MTALLFADITIFVLSLFVGFEVISKVPATLHTPLMSGSNAIHGVVVVGVMVLAATVNTPLGYLLLGVSAAFAALNVVGGYVVTDRMLQMFRPRRAPKPTASQTS